MNNIRFSNHARNRFKQRFPQIVKEFDDNATLAMANRYHKSTINNSFKNNTAYMIGVYERHGYNDISISTYDDIVFVIKGDSLVTVMCAEAGRGLHNRMIGDKSSFRNRRQ